MKIKKKVGKKIKMTERLMTLEQGIDLFKNWGDSIREREEENKKKRYSSEPKVAVILREAPPMSPVSRRRETGCRPHCPSCGNNDSVYGKSIYIEAEYMSSGWDLRCLACGQDSPVWTYQPGEENFKRVLRSDVKK
jgi:hypothetical protein